MARFGISLSNATQQRQVPRRLRWRGLFNSVVNDTFSAIACQGAKRFNAIASAKPGFFEMV